MIIYDLPDLDFFLAYSDFKFFILVLMSFPVLEYSFVSLWRVAILLYINECFYFV